jgi:peroxiredoxin family protein
MDKEATMAKELNKKVSMVVMSGDFDKLFASFIIATGAAATGNDVTMFFTFWGLRAVKKKMPTGKTLFGRMVGMMYGGDINRATPSKFSFGGIGRWMFKKMMKNRGVASLPDLRQTAIDLGVHLYACQMSMDVMEIPKEALIDDLEACVGAGFFIEQAANSDFTLFI